MARVTSEDAAVSGAQFAAFLSAHPLEVGRLRAGQALSPAAEQFYEAYAIGQKITAFRLFTEAGAAASPPVPSALGRTKLTGLAAGATHLVTSDFPLMAKGQPPLRLEVVSDQTIREDLFSQEMWRSFIALCFLTACSFGVPAFVFLREVTRRERGEERMEFLVQHDIMTALMNRSAFNAALERELSAPKPRSVALFFIDLDRFKSVNDSLGHNVGDGVIKTVASRLTRLLAPEDFAARFGGDEFVLAQVGLANAQEAENRAKLIQRTLSEPMIVGDHQVRTTVSIGVALAPDDARTLADLTRAADLALYSAKAGGRDASRLYDPRMDAALQKRQKIEKALLAAVSSHGFDLHFQPIVRSGSKGLLGFEVLLRLKSEDGTPIPPTEFIPIAEEMGLIAQIGSWVLTRACQSAAKWPDHLMVAVNLSPRQFDQDNLCSTVEEAILSSGLRPGRLELEITEGLLLADTERVINQLRRLKDLGVSIAMDDFGTGYSSLSYLWRFPFDKLKIDRSFMPVLTEGDANVASILNTIVALGRALNLRVTAEGVETEEQARLLEDLKCDQLQGYHFGRPMPEAELAALVAKDVFPPLADLLPKKDSAQAA